MRDPTTDKRSTSDLTHRIKYSHHEKDLNMTKKLIKYMFFRNENILMNLGRKIDLIEVLLKDRDEKGIVDIALENLNSL